MVRAWDCLCMETSGSGVQYSAWGSVDLPDGLQGAVAYTESPHRGQADEEGALDLDGDREDRLPARQQVVDHAAGGLLDDAQGLVEAQGEGQVQAYVAPGGEGGLAQ